MAALSLCCFMLIRFGDKGLLDVRRPWRLLLFVIFAIAMAYGGYRARLALVFGFLSLQFLYERLWRTWLLPWAAGIGIAAAVVIVPNADRLPEGVQRSLSFLPVKVDPVVREDADSTVKWRVEMWREVTPDILKYFWLGKGYGFDQTDVYVATQMAVSGLTPDYVPFILLGLYHEGGLSVIIPFGVLGAIAFLWFLGAGWWALWRNYRFGAPELTTANTFLLTYFTVRLLFFFFIFGALEFDLMYFTGALGLSVALNGGVMTRTAKSRDALTASQQIPTPAELATQPAG